MTIFHHPESMGSLSKCSTGYRPALGEGCQDNLSMWLCASVRVFLVPLHLDPAVVSQTLQGHHKESGCPWGQKTSGGNAELRGAESGRPLAVVFHTRPSRLSPGSPSQAQRDRANPRAPPAITGRLQIHSRHLRRGRHAPVFDVLWGTQASEAAVDHDGKSCAHSLALLHAAGDRTRGEPQPQTGLESTVGCASRDTPLLKIS